MFLFDFFKNKKTALVLSGGGSRGFYHVGVIKAIQELGIKIDIISGTSIGAIVGAMYASNPKINFDEVVKELDFFKIVKMFLSHIDKTPKSKLEDLLKKYITARDFKDFKIPLIFNAVDINNAKEVVFSKGSVFPEIFSSMSVPGVFPPLFYDGKYLVDGAVLNNLPIKHIENKYSKIIVSDISTNITIDNKTNILGMLKALLSVAQKNNTLENILELKSFKNKKIIVFTAKEDKLFFLDFRKSNYKKLIQSGYDDVMKRKNELLK